MRPSGFAASVSPVWTWSTRQGVDQKVIDYLAEVQEKARQATLTTQLADRDAQVDQPDEQRKSLTGFAPPAPAPAAAAATPPAAALPPAAASP